MNSSLLAQHICVLSPLHSHHTRYEHHLFSLCMSYLFVHLYLSNLFYLNVVYEQTGVLIFLELGLLCHLHSIHRYNNSNDFNIGS